VEKSVSVTGGTAAAGDAESTAERFREILHFRGHDLTDYSPLQLAYLGDAVYELIIRSYVLNQASAPVEKLHRHTTRLVKADAQAAAYHALEDSLTEEEKSIFRRGRNAKSYSRAKNASLSAYRTATGFETLMGWLFLTEQFDRLAELTGFILDAAGEPRPDGSKAMSGDLPRDGSENQPGEQPEDGSDEKGEKIE
jgi:ribonuclease-3 family protein